MKRSVRKRNGSVKRRSVRKRNGSVKKSVWKRSVKKSVWKRSEKRSVWKRFRKAKPEGEERPGQFIVRLKNYFTKWMELSKVEKSFDGVVE